jgi:hypothetical protein
VESFRREAIQVLHVYVINIILTKKTYFTYIDTFKDRYKDTLVIFMYSKCQYIITDI